MDSTINISPLAYCKIILHAIKYPHSSVKGVLLGRRQSGDVEVQDAIPGLHSTMLAPPLEVLFIHLEAYCLEKQQLEIVGLYSGNQLLANNGHDLDDQWMRVAADKIPNSIVMQIDHSKLSLNAVSPCLRAFEQESPTKWKELEFTLVNSDDTLALASLAVQNKLHRSLADFENHLDDPQVADFYNVEMSDKLLAINDI